MNRSSLAGLTLALMALVACGRTPQTAAEPATATAVRSQAVTGASTTYLVLFKANSVATDAIKKAGGTITAAYGAIGVAVVQSASPTFAADVRGDSRVQGAAPTAPYATRINTQSEAAETAITDNAPTPFSDPLTGLQWDMRQMHVPEALAVTGGSRSILVGDVDTGLDFTHPDLAPNVDFANSVSCLGGVPDPSPSAWMDDNGHGTHTAGTIAAASNGIGIVGVAPNVRLAGIRAGNADGYFFPEAVVCSFMWAASHGMNVLSNSYFADPWLFNCRNDADQRAIWLAEQRAIRYAMTRGVTVVAAAGNEWLDLSKQNVDVVSPDIGTPLTRDVTNACLVIPAEIPGVVTVSADGNKLLKSFYSSYGVGVVTVTAPGGDSIFQRTAESPNGRVLSTWPAAIPFFSSLTVHDGPATYVYLQGTSMATPHVAGLAALIESRFGPMMPGAILARLTGTADNLPCPPNPFDPGGSGTFLATCEGGTGYNGFYGYGQVNALKAITP